MTMAPKTDDPTKTAMANALVPLVDWLDCTSLAVNSLAPVNSLFAPSGASRTFSPTLAEKLLNSLEAWRAPLRSCRSKAGKKGLFSVVLEVSFPFLGSLSLSSSRRKSSSCGSLPPAFFFFQCFLRARR